MREDSRRLIAQFLMFLSLVLFAVGAAPAPCEAATPQVAAGCYHSVALKEDGSVWAWGANYWGQAGDGSTESRSTPVQVTGLSAVTAVAAGCTHSLALKSDGTVWAWGGNDAGQVGDGSIDTIRTAPVQVTGLSGVKAIAAGAQHSVAVKEDGTVWSWGNNWYGQVGDGTDTNERPIPVQVSNISGAVAVSAGGYHTIALKGDHTVWGWGGNDCGQVGEEAAPDVQNTPVQVGVTGVTAVGAGGYHTVVIKGDGTVWAWGLNDYGQLGAESEWIQWTPVQVVGVTGAIAVEVGDNHSVVLKNDGSVWAWGGNGYGQLGVGNTNNGARAATLTGISAVAGIAAGHQHTLALKSDGTVWSWGGNDDGQLGNGRTLAQATPFQVPGVSGVAAVTAGDSFSIARTVSGALWSWGGNGSGQLGDGSTDSRFAPRQIAGISGVVNVAARRSHVLAVKGDGSVWGWGNNTAGLLGDGTTQFRMIPVEVPGFSGATTVITGEFHSAALKGDGTVWAWGWNGYGQLGDGSNVDRRTPGQVPGLSGVSAISAGAHHNLALKGDGTVWAWGSNSEGQLGDGTTASQSAPQQVPGLSGVVAIAAGSFSSYALKNDGSVWGWGSNPYGQIGDGGTERRTTPVAVSGITGATAIAAGCFHAAALKSGGALWMWGRGNYGQLADAANEDRATPAAVTAISDLSALAGGELHTLGVKGGAAWAWGNAADGAMGTDPGWSPVQTPLNLGAVQYTVTPVAEAGGAISPATPQLVRGNDTTSFTVTPDPGYRIGSVSGCGGALSGNSYTTGPVAADCTVTASFAGIPVYSISGSVTAASAAAVAGATVTLTGAASRSASTDAGGNYSFASLPPGSYSISAAKSGFIISPVSRAVTVTSSNVTGQSFTATPVYSISGSVKTAAGGAIAGVTVYLSGTAARTTSTDSAGNFSFTGLLKGNYVIKPVKVGYFLTPASRAVTVSSNVTAQSFVGTPIYSLSGSVKTASGVALPGVTVSLTGAAVKSTITDKAGNYTFAGLLKGSYALKPAKAGYIFTPANKAVSVSSANVTGQNFAATPTYTISGSVRTASGAAVPAAIISLSGTAVRSATTDSAGNYTLSGLVKGSYVLKAGKAGYLFAPASRAVAIGSANIAGQSFIAIPTFTLSGTVKSSSGAPLSGVIVSLGGSATRTATTNSYGNYSFTGLLKGSYTLKPVKTGYLFTPAARSLAVSANVTAQNFTATRSQ